MYYRHWILPSLRKNLKTYSGHIMGVTDLKSNLSISGEVRNNLATPLTDEHYVTWTLKQEESIVGAHLVDSLLPGQTITYTRDIQVWGLSAPPISVAAQGVVSPTLALNQSMR